MSDSSERSPIDGDDPGQIDIDVGRVGGFSRRAPSWRRRRTGKPLFVLFGAALMLLLFAVGLYHVQLASRAPRLAAMDDRQIDELATLRFTAELRDADAEPGSVTFKLIDAPKGATIDAGTGEFSWTPSERQGPGWYRFQIRAELTDAPSRGETREIGVLVEEVDRPPVVEPVETQSVEAGAELLLTVSARDPDHPAVPLRYRLVGEIPPGARIDGRTGRLRWRPGEGAAGRRHKINVRVSEAVRDGAGADLSFEVEVGAAARTVEVEPPAVKPKDERPVEPPVGKPRGPREDPVEARLLALYDENRYFVPREYPTLRKIHADRFALEHEDAIRRALGKNHYKMTAWFDANPLIKEEFFTAIDPKHDSVVGAIRLFGELVEKYPGSFPNYATAAIAVAVVWDDPRSPGIQGYAGCQRAAKGVMPEGRVGAVENYQYLVDAVGIMQGRARFLPWEFLTLVVNHRTPIGERHWAVRNYLPKRPMIGKCYHDVPYDNIMRETGSRSTRMSGQLYTLEHLRQFGGVCVNQADFASRVAKSLGVPASSVGGASRSLDGHAWVMWVELLGVTEKSVLFELKSHGRYRGDRYYVGGLRDPQTGLPITDRQLELRLHAVGQNAQNKRHAALLMKSYPVICRRRNLDTRDRLIYLDHVMKLSPGNEDAWREVARMSREGRLTKRDRRTIMGTLNNLFVVFARFPDFTWEVFDDLMAFEDRAKQRGQFYRRLVAMYVSAGRPDLACKAVLKYADERLADKEQGEVFDGLADTILAFADEGRYVPKMLDKLEVAAKGLRDGQEELLDFYQTFLPRVPRARGDCPSEYCKQMYRRAIERFRQGGRPEAALLWQNELGKLEASKIDVK